MYVTIEIPGDAGTVRIVVIVVRAVIAMTETAETETVVVGIGMTEVAEMTGIAGADVMIEIVEADVMTEIEVVVMIVVAVMIAVVVDQYFFILLLSMLRIKESTFRYIY